MTTFYVPRPPVDDPWQGKSGFSALRLPGALTAPFVNVRWRFNYDDSAFWLRESLSLPVISMPAGGGIPFKPPYWKANYDDSAFWLRSSAPFPPGRLPDMGGIPFKPPYWKYQHDDPGFWVGAKNRSFFIPVLPLTYQITSTNEVQLPVNCVMMGDQVYDCTDYYDGLPPGHGGLRPAKGGLWGKRK